MVYLPIDLNINHFDKVKLPLCLQIVHRWSRKAVESLEDFLIDHEAEPVPRRTILTNPSTLDPSMQLLANSFGRRVVQITVFDDGVGVSLPDFASRSIFLCLGASAGAGVSKLFKALILDPSIDHIEGSREGRIRARSEDCSPDREAPGLYESLSIQAVVRTAQEGSYSCRHRSMLLCRGNTRRPGCLTKALRSRHLAKHRSQPWCCLLCRRQSRRQVRLP